MTKERFPETNFQRRTIPLNVGSTPIDRSGQGEEFEIGASGGLFFEKVNGSPIWIRFDESPVKIPIVAGRSIDKAFKRFSIVHDAVHSGEIEIIVYEKGDGIFDSAASGSFFTNPTWDHEIWYPSAAANKQVGTNTQQNIGISKNGLGTPNFFGNAFGGVTPKYVMTESLIGFELLHSRTQNIAESAPIEMPLTDKPRQKLADIRRVTVDSFGLALRDAPALGDVETGLQYLPKASTGLPWITGGNAAWGLFYYASDGKWHWNSNTGKVGDVAIDWPNALTEPTKVTIVHIAASPTRAGIVRLYVEGVLILERNWEAGTLLPDYNAGGAQIHRIARAHDTNGVPTTVGLQFFDWHTAQGKYDHLGIEY